MIETLLHTAPLLGAIPGLDLVDIIIGLGVLAVIFVVFAESGLLIGFFLPGDSLLFTAGILYHAGVLPGSIPIDIHLFVFLLFLAAVLGDTVGYWVGREAGPRLFKKPDAKIFKQSHILKAQAFYEKYGGKTIIIARFVPIVRTFAPVVAGIGKMSYRHFLSYNVIGGFAWTYLITYLGYGLGELFQQAGIDIDHVLLPVIALIIFLSILPPTIEILKVKSNRDNIKKHITTFFSRGKKK